MKRYIIVACTGSGSLVTVGPVHLEPGQDAQALVPEAQSVVLVEVPADATYCLDGGIARLA